MPLLTVADIQIKLTQFELDFEMKAMKLSIFFMIGSFAYSNQAGSTVSNSNDIIHSQIRHWAMPNYRRMGNIEIAKPKYNRLSRRRNQDIKRMLDSLNGPAEGSRISSIWYSYTQNLFWLHFQNTWLSFCVFRTFLFNKMKWLKIWVYFSQFSYQGFSNVVNGFVKHSC